MVNKKHNASQGSFVSFRSVPSLPDGCYAGDKPNPNLRRFVESNATPYDPNTDDYSIQAFNKAISTTKATAIYNMHSYHQGKKPHDAIREYIRHYTNVGDIVMDPFCGSGGTALAAVIEGRKAIASDRSPAATFITKNYCTPVDPESLSVAFDDIIRKVQPELDWLYETICDRCDGKAKTVYTVYSQVFQCPRCLHKVPQFECEQSEDVTKAGKPKKVRVCPHCKSRGHIEVIRSQSKKFGSVPVLVAYHCMSGCDPIRSERRSDDTDANKRKMFEKCDLAKIKEIESKEIPHWYPKGYDMTQFSRYQRDALFYYEIKEVADMFTKRNLWALSAIREAAESSKYRDEALFGLTGVSLALSRMQRYSPDSGFPNMLLVGTFYIPQIGKEIEVGEWYQGKLRSLLKGYKSIRDQIVSAPQLVITTSDSRKLDVPSNSVDYIFTDPPYSDTVQYGELNYVWEAWLGLQSKWHEEEIIVNEVRGKTEAEWAERMKQVMAECFRVLKPGRWLSLCYHDTSEGTWELIQDIMAEVGFIVDKTESALFIDTGQKSFNQLTADKSTKRDLVLNFRKPKPAEWRMRFYEPGNFQDAARNVVRDFLSTHPGATKDRVYDAVISVLVQKGQMEAHDFDALLRSVAEEVQQPVKEDLFHNKEPDLWGSHIQSRWYLKETADQVDQAEQAKEDAVVTHLRKFIEKFLKKRPEFEGVHYSDLFEQYLPIQDKPRRLLADWLPEYFIKMPCGTWRLPNEDEADDLALLREAGTLRRIKRFANALIDGVPLRDKDRPGNDVDLLDWLRQCRRAGLFEQGKAIYEKGGLNLANLTDEQQIEAEDDYRICVRRGSVEDSKPKRKSRKKQDDDE